MIRKSHEEERDDDPGEAVKCEEWFSQYPDAKEEHEDAAEENELPRPCLFLEQFWSIPHKNLF